RDRVLVESPTYPNATQALRTGGGRLLTVPLDPLGWDLETLTGAVTRRRPRLAFLMPDFHNPTGLVMSETMRRDVARLLARHDCIPVIDEAHHLLTLDDSPACTPFARHAKDTITIGSASKSIWGGLRLGWLRAPEPLIDRLTAARIQLDLGAPVLEQLVLARLLENGLGAIIDGHRARLREQRDVLAAELAEHLPDWRFRLPAGGMVLWCELPIAASTALVYEAERVGVHLPPGPAFAPEGGLDRFVRVPFTLAPDTIREAVRRLAAAWAVVVSDERRGAGGRRTPAAGAVDPVLVA
ncbi:PLP-dependent aminotransferase family protein, partial [Nocardioides sp.]